jgi:hypothetical protein
MFDFNGNNLTESFKKTWVTDVDMRNVKNPGQVRNTDYLVPSYSIYYAEYSLSITLRLLLLNL